MNQVALLTSLATSGSTSQETTQAPAGLFLSMLTSMLGNGKEAAATPFATQPTSEEAAPLASPLAQADVELVTDQLEQWIQQPETLKWLKTLPAEAYRSFMDAYAGIVGQGTASPDGLLAANPLLNPAVVTTVPIPKQMGIPTELDATLPSTPVKVETQLQIIQQIVTKFVGPGQEQTNAKPTPFQQPQGGAQPVTKQVVLKETVDWMPKGMTWTRPQIAADTVMYASKGSLPENLQARIEAALQKAPFSSGADGSKVFTVRLYPEQLGELVVKLERQNGELVVKLFASNQEARHLLQSQAQQLQQTLQPLSQHVRVEINLTQQALDAKTTTYDGSSQGEPESQQEQPKGEPEDDEHPTEDE